MKQPELPILFPPIDAVRQLGGILEPGVPRLILDAGTGTGRNAHYLTELGHTVVRLSNDAAELTSSNLPTAEAAIHHGGRVVADVSSLPFGTVFDIALMNEVTHC